MSNDEFDNLQPQSYLNVDQLIKLYDSYNKRSLEPTTKEKLIINPKLAYEITDQLLHDSIPYELIKRYRDVYGEISKVSKVDPVSNLNWDFLYFVNSDYFRPAALAFERSERAVIGSKIKASYTQHIPGTKSYEKFWEQEFTRIVNGYEPIIDGKLCGLRISGEFYFYLNYCRIEKVTRDSLGKTIVKSSFPDFLAMDYYYFKELESRENPSIYGYDDSYKRSIALVKSRRKGFSYKAAAGCVWIAAFNKKARVGIASEPNTGDATDAVKCARKCLPIIDHLTLYTPFGRKNPGDPKINGGWIHAKAKNTDKYFSFTFGLENTKTRGQRGRMSSIFTMSLSKDDAASGEGLNRLYFEESGKISNLDKAWIFARESMKAGSLFRGIGVLYGCLTENNKVWLPNGSLKPIKEIKEGDKLLGYNKKEYSIEEATYVKPPENKECIRITTDRNTIIECSIDHPILWSHKDYRYNHRITENGKRISKGSYKITSFNEAQFIREGEQIAVIDTLDIFGNEKMWNPRLVGLLIGDGSYGPDKTPVMSNADIEINNYLCQFDIVVEKEYITQDKKLYKETRIRNITKNLRELGIYGQSKCNKTLPDDLHKYDKESFCELIGGLYDADGSVSYYKSKKGYTAGSIVLTSSCENLLRDVKSHMIKLGIHGTINKIKPNLNKNKRIKDVSEYYRYVISDIKSVKKFKDNISFMVKHKQHNLNLLASVNKKEKRTKVFMSFKHQGDRRNKLIEMSNIRFETVKKIEKIGEQPIYNLTANSTHTYIANNIVTHNTGGEMKSSSGADGSSKAFSTLFNNPVAAELAAYDNIYEYKNSNEKCGYFVADMWSNFGAYIKIDGKIYESLDKMGNAYFWVAELALNKERYDKMPPKGKQKDYNDFLTQRCKTPSEAFLVTSTNIFNSADIIARINKIKMEKGGFSKYRTPGELYTTANNNVQFKPNNLLEPVTNTNQSSSNREGCLLVYETPIKINGSIPEGAYIIAVDPIAMNNSGGNSLNAVIVIKTPRYSDVMGPEKIVATYFGRSSVRPLDYLHRLLLNLSKYYNAQISHENDRDGGILSFFTHKNELHRLMPSPRLVTKKYLPGSKTLLREFGHSMGNERLKSVGEGYLNEWLDFRHPSRKLVNESTGNIEEKEGLRNLDMIYDELILDELVNYNRNGNFDSTMALMGAMVQLSDKFNTQGDVFVDNDYYNEIDRQMVSYIKDKVGDYF